MKSHLSSLSLLATSSVLTLRATRCMFSCNLADRFCCVASQGRQGRPSLGFRCSYAPWRNRGGMSSGVCCSCTPSRDQRRTALGDLNGSLLSRYSPASAPTDSLACFGQFTYLALPLSPGCLGGRIAGSSTAEACRPLPFLDPFHLDERGISLGVGRCEPLALLFRDRGADPR